MMAFSMLMGLAMRVAGRGDPCHRASRRRQLTDLVDRSG